MNVLIVVLIYSVCRTGIASDCDDMTDCESCIKKGTWIPNVSCRWCELDRSCHTYGKLIDNACDMDQNIVDSNNNCPVQKPYGVYDSQEAYRQLLLSAVAYSDTPEECLKGIPILDDYRMEIKVNKRCRDDDFYYMCQAYIAVSDKYKDIIVAFRGTINEDQLTDEETSVLFKPKVSSSIGGEVEKYFKDASDNLYPCLKETLQFVKIEYPQYDVKITGHSLGAAIASVTSARLVWDQIVNTNKMTLYTFGMPRVGDAKYALSHDQLVNNSFRVVHARDIVVHLPSCKWLPCPHKPYHHRTEIYYPNQDMTVDSYYKTCHSDEDQNCSNGAVDDDGCLSGLSIVEECKHDHRYYFNIEVGNYCRDTVESLRFRRSANVTSFNDTDIDTEDHCRAYRYDGKSWTRIRGRKKETSSRGTSAANQKVVLAINLCVVAFMFALT